MSDKRGGSGPTGGPPPAPDFFDLEGSDPELLNSGRLPDPQPQHTPLFRWLARLLTSVEARLRARGDRLLRNAIRFVWVLVALAGAFLLFGPIINKPLNIDDVLDSAKVSEVDWIATDAVIDYTLERTADRGFAARVSERYTANFTNGPESVIERKFVTEFQGHDTGFEVRSATIDGVPAEVTVDRGATVTRVAISRADGAKLEGEQEIALDYSMRDLVTTEEDAATGRQIDSWSWPVLGPSWPQGTKGVQVSLTLPPELDDALVRAPRAYVGWLLLGATEWLTPEDRTAQGVRYSFSNDDTLPPYPDLLIDTSFEAGTFSQPPTTTLFWWQTWGPLFPLALLAAILLFALAARRVVWADSVGEPWYLVRAEVPDGLSPADAAQLLGRPWHAELISELAGVGAAPNRTRPTKPAAERKQTRLAAMGARARELWLTAVARAGMRAGRIGNLPSVVLQRLRWSRADRPVQDGLRWVPDSYVRDTFIFGPLAIALLQWGLLRQLSQQVILSVVWWPGLFVLASTVLALCTVGVVLRPRPLTRDGALAVQQLKGIDAYARATRLLDRGPVDEPLLPYAVLFEGPRRAGRKVAEHAGREAGDRRLGRGWRTEHFLSLPAILALVAAIALLAGSILTVATRPTPYTEADFVTWPGSGPSGTIWSQIEGFEVDAELQRDKSGGARLSVVERDTVRFTSGGASVPQLAREWPRERLGQDLGLEVESVRVDGEDVPFREIDGPQSVAMTTRMSDVLDGLYEVEIAYTLTSPVVDAPGGPDSLQQLRWTAWYDFWKETFYTNAARPSDGTAPVRPIRLQLTIAPEIADEIRSGGWIDSDVDRDRVPYERGNWYRPWQYENRIYIGGDLETSRAYDLRIGSEKRLDDGALVVSVDANTVESREAEDSAEGKPAGPWQVSEKINGTLEKYELNLNNDLGAVLNFSPGTFSGVDAGAYERYRTEYALPYATVLALAGAVTVSSLGVLVFALRVRRRPSASLRTIAFGAIPLAAVAQSVLFGWAVMSMDGDDARGWAAIVIGGVMLAAVTAEIIALVRRRNGGGARANRRRFARGRAE
ncbi:DUF2207 domain-containing protein [Leucobacter sp. wl10]|uniref:DUF2207 domain-containing protein n=1 Tax=Leucobacter sp. wl10 TaxID=2304677 RepID=UPI000E5AB644|nr:DUF2207 domain-containing protein [Leucobacter sp. wl10]RGE22765.1 DUF2207 domain-containing protein [Leucobacter sp. wl10]